MTGVFTRDAARFFEALGDDNSKAFFDAHREEYEAAVRRPLETLLGEAEQRYGPGRAMRRGRMGGRGDLHGGLRWSRQGDTVGAGGASHRDCP